MSRNGKVIIAMSGGVDSSVAAALLKEQGYDCVGVFMRVGVERPDETCAIPAAAGEGSGFGAQGSVEGSGGRVQGSGKTESGDSSVAMRAAGTARTVSLPTVVPRAMKSHKHGCCSANDALDARTIAGKLGIPFYALNFRADFDRIIDYFVDEYRHARTPNPCVMCNIHLKFGKLLRYADMVDAEFVATGHYARIDRTANGQARLARAINIAKDQSYVLFGIRRADLARCIFPIGEIADKAEVRRIAATLGMRVHDKPDSQEICFVPDNDYRGLLRERAPDVLRTGALRDTDGRVLGTHEGVAQYTIGQRRGLGLAVGSPLYVTKLDAETNTLTVGPKEALLRPGLIAADINWHVDPECVPLADGAAGAIDSAPGFRCTIKIRHMHTPAPGRIARRDDGTIEARFDESQAAITPGQAAVFYENDRVIAGGWIRAAI